MLTDAEPVPALLTPAEVAARLRISRAHVYRLASAGELHALRLGARPGSSLRVPRSELERFLGVQR
jgi:excisionase family DNA binding protein